MQQPLKEKGGETMSEKLTPEQTKLLMELIEKLQEQGVTANSVTQGKQEVTPPGLEVALPTMITNLVTLPLTGATNILIGNVITPLVGVLTGLGGIIGLGSLTGQGVPQGLLNVVKREVPVQNTTKQ